MTEIAKKSERKIYTSLLLATLTGWLVAQPGMGFLLILLLIPLLIWVIYRAYRMVRSPESRRNQLIRVVIWLVAVALMAGIHYLRYVTARQNADEVVATLHRYALRQGHYPATLAEAGISQGKLRYRGDLRKPRLYYGGTFLPFEFYEYDFEQGVWRQLAD